MISINNSDWRIPIPHCYFYIIYTGAHVSGMQIEDLAPFTVHSSLEHGLAILTESLSPLRSTKLNKLSSVEGASEKKKRYYPSTPSKNNKLLMTLYSGTIP